MNCVWKIGPLTLTHKRYGNTAKDLPVDMFTRVRYLLHYIAIYTGMGGTARIKINLHYDSSFD